VRPLHRIIRRVAQEAPAEYEKGAFQLAAITGGTPKVWGPDELLIEDAGPGIHLYYQHGGASMEIKPGNADYRLLAEWLRGLAQEHSVRLDNSEGSLADSSNFARILRKILASDDVLTAQRENTVLVVGGRWDALRATGLLTSERAQATLAWYYGIPNQAGPARM